MVTTQEFLAQRPAGAPSGQRVEFVDALRGFALFGLLVVHCVQSFGAGFDPSASDPWTDSVMFLFAGKAFAIFALLFGFGFATIMANQAARGVDFTARFAWRLTLLLLIGTLHTVIYNGDILQVLALLGFVLIPLHRIKRTTILLALALVCFLQLPLLIQIGLADMGVEFAQSPPYFVSSVPSDAHTNGTLLETSVDNATDGMAGKWSFNWSTGRVSEIIGLFIVGLVLQRKGAFASMSQRRSLALTVSVVGAAMTAVVYFLVEPLLPAKQAQVDFDIQAFNLYWIYQQWLGLSMITLQIGVLALAWNSFAQPVVALFKLPGRMTLSLYVLHSVFAAPFFYAYGLGMWDDLTPSGAVAVAVVFFAGQILFARWWYERYRYGPLEWTWRAATLTDFSVPMRKPAQAN